MTTHGGVSLTLLCVLFNAHSGKTSCLMKTYDKVFRLQQLITIDERRNVRVSRNVLLRCIFISYVEIWYWEPIITFLYI
jgi:hypothetical protein